MIDTDGRTPDISAERVEALGKGLREAAKSTLIDGPIYATADVLVALRTALDETEAECDALKALVARMREAMLAVLCSPEGTPCFAGSDGDRQIIADVLSLIPADLAGCVVVKRTALKDALDFIRTERDSLFESFCVWRDGKPDPSTMEADERAYIANWDSLISQLTAALTTGDNDAG